MKTSKKMTRKTTLTAREAAKGRPMFAGLTMPMRGENKSSGINAGLGFEKSAFVFGAKVKF